MQCLKDLWVKNVDPNSTHKSSEREFHFTPRMGYSSGITQRRFAERGVNANVAWCVVIGQCHGNSAQRHQFVRHFQRWRWRDVHLMVVHNLQTDLRKNAAHDAFSVLINMCATHLQERTGS